MLVVVVVVVVVGHKRGNPEQEKQTGIRLCGLKSEFRNPRTHTVCRGSSALYMQ